MSMERKTLEWKTLIVGIIQHFASVNYRIITIIFRQYQNLSTLLVITVEIKLPPAVASNKWLKPINDIKLINFGLRRAFRLLKTNQWR